MNMNCSHLFHFIFECSVVSIPPFLAVETSQLGCLYIFMASFMQRWQDFSAMGVNNKLILPSVLQLLLMEIWANSCGNWQVFSGAKV